jgi:hypothetical protein
MGVISDAMPLVADQAGVWDGEYVHLNANHEIIDRHKSRLVCRLQEDDPAHATLAQTNIYTWGPDDQEIRYFETVFRGDRLWVDNDLIKGWVGPDNMDLTKRTIMVGWVSKLDAGLSFYEFITVALDGNAKNRTWHWYREGRLFQRTIINEVRTSRDWKAYDDPSYYAYKLRSAK